MTDPLSPDDAREAAVRILNGADIFHKEVRFPGLLDKLGTLSLSNEPTLLITAVPGKGVGEALRTLLGRDAPQGQVHSLASEGGAVRGPEEFIVRKKCIPLLEKAGVQMHGLERFKKYQNTPAR